MTKEKNRLDDIDKAKVKRISATITNDPVTAVKIMRERFGEEFINRIRMLI